MARGGHDVRKNDQRSSIGVQLLGPAVRATGRRNDNGFHNGEDNPAVHQYRCGRRDRNEPSAQPMTGGPKPGRTDERQRGKREEATKENAPSTVHVVTASPMGAAVPARTTLAGTDRPKKNKGASATPCDQTTSRDRRCASRAVFASVLTASASVDPLSWTRPMGKRIP